MFNTDNVKTGTVAVCVCDTVPVPTYWKTYNCFTKNAVSLSLVSVSVRWTKKEGSVCLSLPSHKALDLYSHTHTRKSTTTDCASETVQWRSLAWISIHHRLPPPPPLLIPIHRLCACRSSAGLEQCAPPHPHQLLDCRKRLLFPSYNYVY